MADEKDIVALLKERAAYGYMPVKTRQALQDARSEIVALREQLAEARAREDGAWRERNVAVTKVRAWEATVFHSGIKSLPSRAVSVEEWGPGEGETVTVPHIMPQKLTELLDELSEARGEVAQIVAWLREEAAMRFRLHDEQPIDGYNHTRGIAVAMAADAIAAGQHKGEQS